MDRVNRIVESLGGFGGNSRGRFPGCSSAGDRVAFLTLSLSLIFRRILPKIRIHHIPSYFLSRALAVSLPTRSLLLPYFMQIEPTTSCDLACGFCPRKNLATKGDDLSLNAFKEIVDRNPSVVAILLQGLGEPLLHLELEEMIRYGRSKGVYMGTCTNGMRLNSKRIESLMASGLNYLAISVDGTGEVFENMRGGASFDTLVQNLSELRGKEKADCLIAFWMTLSEQNIDQVFPVLDLAEQFGVAHVHFQDLQYKHQPEELRLISLSNVSDGDLKMTLVSSARRKASQAGIVSTFDPIDQNQMRTHCKWPWEKIYVDCRTDVWPCCVAWHEGYRMGNLLEDPLAKIWRGSRYGQFRLSLRRGPIPEICKMCRLL